MIAYLTINRCPDQLPDPKLYCNVMLAITDGPSGANEPRHIPCTHTERRSTSERPSTRPLTCTVTPLTTRYSERPNGDIPAADPSELHSCLRGLLSANGGGSTRATTGGLGAAPNSGSGSGNAALGAGKARDRSAAAAPRSMAARSASN